MIELLEYPLGEGVRAFSTTRHGGVGHGVYGQFNINPFCGDDAEAVAVNRGLLATELGIDASHIILPHQVHQSQVLAVTPGFLKEEETEQDVLLEGVDALVTDVRGVCVGVSTADCIPLLLFDEEHHAVAAVHAGWRGTVRHIVVETVLDMICHYQTRPQTLRAVIGPGISLRRFEVGKEVYDAFQAAAFPMEEVAGRFPAMQSTGNGTEKKWHIDLKRCNRLDLTTAGVAEENIHDAGICTYDHADDFFSARRLGALSGRIYTGILLK